MKDKLELKSVSDNELLRRLSELLQNFRRVEVEIIAHMAEVGERRLYRKCSSSMFTYSTEILHLAEHEAYLRIKVARASLEYPELLEMLADGRLHLSAIVVLRPHLTKANRECRSTGSDLEAAGGGGASLGGDLQSDLHGQHRTP